MAVSIKLDSADQDRLRALAEQRDRSPHYLMREAIQQYLDREEKRESFQREALAAWAAFQETGLHVSAEDTERWLESWGSGSETAPPQAHE
jgi:predicted transcriptional regulator